MSSTSKSSAATSTDADADTSDLSPCSISDLPSAYFEHPDLAYQRLSISPAWKYHAYEMKEWHQTHNNAVPDHHARVVCVSDTHLLHDFLGELPYGDILIHAGDFSNTGTERDLQRFTTWLQQQTSKFHHIVVIAGNHDLVMDVEAYTKTDMYKRFHHPQQYDAVSIKRTFIRVLEEMETYTERQQHVCKGYYLEDSGCEIEGFKIWGSPWQPEFYDWAFNLPRGRRLDEKWSLIPSNIDILVTHGPVIGHGDQCHPHRNRAGCVDLFKHIQTRIKPRYHITGHIHEGYGVTTDGTTHYINASSCNLRYDRRAMNPPVVFDIKRPNKTVTSTSTSTSTSASASASTSTETSTSTSMPIG